jgi:hypothetical protein
MTGAKEIGELLPVSKSCGFVSLLIFKSSSQIIRSRTLIAA